MINKTCFESTAGSRGQSLCLRFIPWLGVLPNLEDSSVPGTTQALVYQRVGGVGEILLKASTYLCPSRVLFSVFPKNPLLACLVQN